MALASRQWLRNTTHSSLPDMAVHPSLADVLWSYDACAQLCCHNIMAPSSNAQAVNDCHARVGHNMASISFPRPAQSGLKEHVTQLVCLSMRQFGTREESGVQSCLVEHGQVSTRCQAAQFTASSYHHLLATGNALPCTSASLATAMTCTQHGIVHDRPWYTQAL